MAYGISTYTEDHTYYVTVKLAGDGLGAPILSPAPVPYMIEKCLSFQCFYPITRVSSPPLAPARACASSRMALFV